MASGADSPLALPLLSKFIESQARTHFRRAGEVLKLELTAPPIDGRAKAACIRFLADFLKVPRSSVTIAAGSDSRNKVIRISGMSDGDVEQALTAIIE